MPILSRKKIQGILGWVAGTLFAIVVISVLGEFFIKLAEKRGFYDQPDEKVRRVMEFLSAISQSTATHWTVGIIVGLAIGVQLDAFLRRKEMGQVPADLVYTSGAKTVNTLASVHQDEKIPMVEFFDPLYHSVENVRFEHCDLIGPTNVGLLGGTLTNCVFSHCEIVIVRPDRPIMGGTILANCLFVRCRLIRLTLLMNYEMYLKLPAEARAGMAVISDGRIGDV